MVMKAAFPCETLATNVTVEWFCVVVLLDFIVVNDVQVALIPSVE